MSNPASFQHVPVPFIYWQVVLSTQNTANSQSFHDGLCHWPCLLPVCRLPLLVSGIHYGWLLAGDSFSPMSVSFYFPWRDCDVVCGGRGGGVATRGEEKEKEKRRRKRKRERERDKSAKFDFPNANNN